MICFTSVELDGKSKEGRLKEGNKEIRMDVDTYRKQKLVPLCYITKLMGRVSKSYVAITLLGSSFCNPVSLL